MNTCSQWWPSRVCCHKSHESGVCLDLCRSPETDLLNPLALIESRLGTPELESKKSPNGICKVFIVTVNYFYILNIISKNIKWQTWKPKICYLVTLLIFKSHVQKLPGMIEKLTGEGSRETLPMTNPFLPPMKIMWHFFSLHKKYTEEVRIRHFFIVHYHRCILTTFWTRDRSQLNSKLRFPELEVDVFIFVLQHFSLTRRQFQ